MCFLFKRWKQQWLPGTDSLSCRTRARTRCESTVFDWLL